MGKDELSKGNMDSGKRSCNFRVPSLRCKARWEVTFEQPFGRDDRRNCEDNEKKPSHCGGAVSTKATGC